jgi:hypothetical protein
MRTDPVLAFFTVISIDERNFSGSIMSACLIPAPANPSRLGRFDKGSDNEPEPQQ